jgi:hypothetical protein
MEHTEQAESPGKTPSVLHVNFVGLLPDELTVGILKHLDVASLCRASQTSKTWKEFIDNSSTLWRVHCYRYGLSGPTGNQSWRTLVLEYFGRCKVKTKWLTGEYSAIQDVSQLEREILVPMSVNDWGDILETELERE